MKQHLSIHNTISQISCNLPEQLQKSLVIHFVDHVMLPLQKKEYLIDRLIELTSVIQQYHNKTVTLEHVDLFYQQVFKDFHYTDYFEQGGIRSYVISPLLPRRMQTIADIVYHLFHFCCQKDLYNAGLMCKPDIKVKNYISMISWIACNIKSFEYDIDKSSTENNKSDKIIRQEKHKLFTQEADWQLQISQSYCENYNCSKD
ncbi:MAG: hypothetical protein LBK06_03435 [Planctomycetaceae bacterium]|jgi:hypothetical protein|nr:hypothetical protein [Planctomycetaceae bacterium]